MFSPESEVVDGHADAGWMAGPTTLGGIPAIPAERASYFLPVK